MCLSKPQKVIKVDGKQALVEFKGSRKIMNTAQKEVKPGDYVLCQSGFVIEKISKDKAAEIMKEWASFS